MPYVIVRIFTTGYPPSEKLRELQKLAAELNDDAIKAGDPERWTVIDEKQLRDARLSSQRYRDRCPNRVTLIDEALPIWLPDRSLIHDIILRKYHYARHYSGVTIRRSGPMTGKRGKGDYQTRIRAAWGKHVPGIIETGRLLLEAKEGPKRVPHGAWAACSRAKTNCRSDKRRRVS
jgi:hypothetical protein